MYGIILQFACKSNFELQGVETVTCDEDGTWSDSMPTCKYNECYITFVKRVPHKNNTRVVSNHDKNNDIYIRL